jgi:hypothetical protein
MTTPGSPAGAGAAAGPAVPLDATVVFSAVVAGTTGAPAAAISAETEACCAADGGTAGGPMMPVGPWVAAGGFEAIVGKGASGRVPGLVPSVLF